MRRWALIALAGCGRLGYDERRVTMPDADAATDATVDAAPDAPSVCPSDTAAISTDSRVCIELVERGEIPWTDAVIACTAIGRRLCTDAEWFEGCVNAVGLVDMIDGGYEWVAEESGGVALKRGSTDCTVMSSHAVIDPYEFRCCADR